MKYTYVEFADGTLVTFNDIRKDKNGEHIDVYFERENVHSISKEGELLLTLLAAFALTICRFPCLT